MTESTIPVSIVIPTYNEEKALPNLLQSIKKQSVQPYEIIVSDNFSKDKTREIARKYGAIVVDGGDVSTGRNNGVKKAKKDIIFAFDADVVLQPGDIEHLYKMFMDRGLDCASAIPTFDLTKVGAIGKVALFASHAMLVVGDLIRHPLLGTGSMMIFKRKVFNAVGGFSTEFAGSAEDLLFLKTAKKSGFKYGVIRHKVDVSNRRYTSKKRAGIVLTGAILMGGVVFFGIKHKKVLDFVRNLYGPLGGGHHHE